MKLALRLVAVALVVIVAIAVTDGVLRVRREYRIARDEVRQYAEFLGHALRPVIVDAWKTGGEDRVKQVIGEINRENRPVHLRWVWLDAIPGSPGAPTLSDAMAVLADQDAVVGLELANNEGAPRAFSYFQIQHMGMRPGALELSEPLTQLQANTRHTLVRVAVVTAITVLLCALFVTLSGVSLIGRPMRRIIEQTQKIGAGDFTAALDFHPPDELGELAEEINEMSAQLQQGREALQRETEARIEALDQLRHADRLQTVGRLASGVAHELGTPLNVVSGRASLIAEDEGVTPEIIEGTKIIRAQCERMTNIIRQLLDFARRNAPRRQSVDLRAIAARPLRLLAPLAQKRGTELELVGADESLSAHIDVGQVEQVLTNLVVNGLDAMEKGGAITVEAGRRYARPPAAQDGAEGEYNYVQIRDQGAGIRSEDLPHIFEPFFTTKDVGRGTGLGLSIAYGIFQEHGGWIDVSSERGVGSCFTVYLPAESK